jgi:MFS family permease
MATASPTRIGLVARGLLEPVVLMTGCTVTIGYGTLYYAYGVVAPLIARDFGVGIDWFFAAFAVGLVFGGLFAPWVGRQLDRRGARMIATVGSVSAAVALAVCAVSPSVWMFVGGVVLMELAACMVLYEAVFAGLTQAFGHDARRRMTAVTLIAGFASTIFWPVSQWLASNLGWRATFLLFALAHLAVCAPLHWLAFRRWTSGFAAGAPALASSDLRPVHQGAERRRAVILYAGAICLSGIIYSAFPIHMLTIIQAEGFSAETAAIIAMVMGPSQVVARLVEVMGGSRFDALTTGKVALVTLVMSISVLLASNGSIVAAVAFAALYGVSQGLITITRGTVPLQLFGPDGYATLVGKITGLRFIVNAGGPYAFAVLTTQAGHGTTILVFAVISCLALAVFFAIRKPRARVAESPHLAS